MEITFARSVLQLTPYGCVVAGLAVVNLPSAEPECYRATVSAFELNIVSAVDLALILSSELACNALSTN